MRALSSLRRRVLRRTAVPGVGKIVRQLVQSFVRRLVDLGKDGYRNAGGVLESRQFALASEIRRAPSQPRRDGRTGETVRRAAARTLEGTEVGVLDQAVGDRVDDRHRRVDAELAETVDETDGLVDGEFFGHRDGDGGRLAPVGEVVRNSRR